MNDLHLDLEQAASQLDVPPGDLDAVVSRAGRRNRNRRRLLAGLGTVAVIAAALATVDRAGDENGTNLAAVGDGLTQAGDAGLEWTVAEPASGIAFFPSAVAAPDGPLYALSTAPGQADYNAARPMRVWSSTDGVDWTDAAAPADDLYLSDLAAHDDRLYAVGTGPATAAVVGTRAVHEVRAGWSDDGGETWASEGLPLDLSAVAPFVTSLFLGPGQIASVGESIVAMVGVHAELDVTAVFPEGETAPDGWALTSTGVDVLGTERGDPCPEGMSTESAREEGVSGDGPDGPQRVWPIWCDDGKEPGSGTQVSPQDARGVVRSYTFDELGVTGDVRDAVLNRPFVFAATAAEQGTVFERATVELPDGMVSATVLGGADGIATLFASTVDDLGRPKSAALLRSIDGRDWTPAVLPTAISWAIGMTAAENATVVLGGDIAGEPVAVTNTNGTWTVQRPADGLEQDGERPVLMGGGAGGLGAALIVGFDTGDGLVDRTTLLLTRDGRTWEAQDIDELAGIDVAYVRWVMVTDDRVVVSVAPRGPDGEQRGIVTLVGVTR